MRQLLPHLPLTIDLLHESKTVQEWTIINPLLWKLKQHLDCKRYKLDTYIDRNTVSPGKI